MGLGIVLALVFALPLFIWGIVTQKFLISQRAASGEPGVCIANGHVITVTPDSDVNGTCHNIQTAVDAATGDGFFVQIKPGTYNIASTINVIGKSNLTIEGIDSNLGQVILNFNSDGWGFKVSGSSGAIKSLVAQGNTPNGMISIGDQSHNFSIGFAEVNAYSSHAIDVYQASDITIDHAFVTSSAGAVEVANTDGFNLINSKILYSANGVRVEGYNINIIGNLIARNSEVGLRLMGLVGAHIENNTIIYNGSNQYNKASVELDGSGNSSMFFNKNIIAYGQGPGLFFNSYQNFTRFTYNDVFVSGTSTYPAYVGMADQTGISGNISEDPLINVDRGLDFCLKLGSPGLYGDVSKGEYMGHWGPCEAASVAAPEVTPTPVPGTPNSCGGTCGSVYNCNMNLFCYQGFCRNPDCPSETSCGCKATPTPKSGAKTTIKPSATSEMVYLTPRPTLRSSASPSASPANESEVSVPKQANNFSYLLWISGGTFALAVILLLFAL
jgi:hypothetical protein